MVGLQAVSSIPIAAAFDQRPGPVDLLFDKNAVAEEYAYSDDCKDDVDLGAEDARVLEDNLVRVDGSFLRADRQHCAQ